MVNIHTGEVAITEPINIIQPPVSFEWESSRCTLRRREDGSYLIGITPLFKFRKYSNNVIKKAKEFDNSMIITILMSPNKRYSTL